MRSEISFGEGLTIVIGDRAARLTPGQGFIVAQTLIKRSTSALVEAQATHELRNHTTAAKASKSTKAVRA